MGRCSREPTHGLLSGVDYSDEEAGQQHPIIHSGLDSESIYFFFSSLLRPSGPSLIALSRSASMASSSSSAKSLFQTLRRYIKKPWEITGPCADPEYKSALPVATDYRKFCPATAHAKAIVPTSNPETVYDIKYYTRDQRRNRPPVRRTVLKKADVEKMMKEKTFDVGDFPRVYLTTTVVEDINARGGGYQK
ncbi:hypothetical protein H6P81_019223 [Aristolochia fimbriata]|uniref:Uncharacterized protein n=1 Tax=Aristolochia fimbriata TaxID=158543 RepID=A0AAV7DR38_ARIFI|nr:hypothetical protein H6P81_019223 [Aristolochia fimbriata]